MSTERRFDEPEEELLRTKVIQFLGRQTQIILQNDNGTCPLIAICNVLLLKNNLNLSLDTSTTEVSPQKLLLLVANKMIDSNSNTKNIDDIIDILPKLTTGIDVNVGFTRIDDFEFTPERAIFDLLDIPLYHGWIPEDTNIANAIGSNSYNTLTIKLVSLEPTEEMHKKCNKLEEDCIDFASATTCLSRGRSFDDSPCAESGCQKARKGDREEEAELLKALELSNTEAPTSFDESSLGEKTGNDSSACSDERSLCSEENAHLKGFDTGVVTETEVQPGGCQQSHQPEQSITLDLNASDGCNGCTQSPETNVLENERTYTKVSSGSDFNQSDCRESPLQSSPSSSVRLDRNEAEMLSTPEENSVTAFKVSKHGPSEDQQIQGVAHREHIETIKSETSRVDNNEPIYEGEDCILDSGVAPQDNQEPMYEGEVVLAEQAEKGEIPLQNEISQHNGKLIKNFLDNNASQLTEHGLDCLKKGLNERELSVLFHNNHFSTMFKFNGELYLLVTDEGYLNQPDLVWGKLNEVKGKTKFMTGNFTEFKMDNDTSDSWDQQNYLSSIDNSAPPDSTFNSDLHLVIALQQQEFDNQPQSSQNSQQQWSGGNLRLVTGPQVKS